MGLLCGYVLHITKGRTIKIPPVVNLMLWQFFLAGFFGVMYGPYNTELETGYETPLQKYFSFVLAAFNSDRFLSQFSFQVLVFLQQPHVGNLPFLVDLRMLPRLWR